MPLGEIQPIFQDTKISRNSAIDKATRTASAQAMRVSRCLPSGSSWGVRYMNTPALARAASTPISAMMITTFMGRDSRTGGWPC